MLLSPYAAAYTLLRCLLFFAAIISLLRRRVAILSSTPCRYLDYYAERHAAALYRYFH